MNSIIHLSVLLLKLLAAIAILITLTSGFDIWASRETAWLHGNINFDSDPIIPVQNLEYKSGTVFDFWIGQWGLCEKLHINNHTKCYQLLNMQNSDTFEIAGLSSNEIYPLRKIPSQVYASLPALHILSLLFVSISLIAGIKHYHHFSYRLACISAVIQFVAFGLTFAFMDHLALLLVENDSTLHKGFTSWFNDFNTTKGLGMIPFGSLSLNVDFYPSSYGGYCINLALLMAIMLSNVLLKNLPNHIAYSQDFKA